MTQPKKILVAPLNWGLGHATRCIPVIAELMRQGAEVEIASDGRALALLRQEFPMLTAHDLPAYGIRYQSDSMVQNLALQLPQILRAMHKEHRALHQLIGKRHLSGVISDNRFGCWSRYTKSIFITHQIDLIVPGRWLEQTVRWANRSLIRRFDECWIPDVAGERNLSGQLSHTKHAQSCHFIGALSRMERFPVAKKYDFVAVISGPEPQRTRFEELLLEQAQRLPYRCLVVLGKSEENARFFMGDHIECVSHLPARALNEAILAGRAFVGRSGYSSVMDLAKLGVPAVLVPTPGQTEQVYLAEQLHRQGSFLMQGQETFDLGQAMEALPRFIGLGDSFFDEKALENAVERLLA